MKTKQMITNWTFNPQYSLDSYNYYSTCVNPSYCFVKRKSAAFSTYLWSKGIDGKRVVSFPDFWMMPWFLKMISEMKRIMLKEKFLDDFESKISRETCIELTKNWIFTVDTTRINPFRKYVCTDRIFNTPQFVCNKIFFWKCIAYIFTILLTSFAFKLVNYSWQSCRVSLLHSEEFRNRRHFPSITAIFRFSNIFKDSLKIVFGLICSSKSSQEN